MLRKSKGNMYKHVNYEWNPIGGRCLYGCIYCYVVRGNARLTDKYKGYIRLIEHEMDTNLGRDNIIFVGSLNDMWGNFVPDEMIIQVLAHCRKYTKNIYFFQTKNPARYHKFIYLIPDGSILCTTLESDDVPIEISLAPPIRDRVLSMMHLPFKKSVTIEPIMDMDFSKMIKNIEYIQPTFVSIGADSKKSNLKEPPREKINKLISELNKMEFIKKIYLKTNLKRLVKLGE